MKHIGIITGATGYIGSHLCQYLLEKGWEIHIIAQPEFGYDNIKNIKEQIHIFEYKHNINALIEYFKKVNAEVVFHLAAAVITNYNPNHIPTLIQSNIQFGTEILEAMRASTTRLIVSTGSYWQNYNSDEYSPVDLYAATKEAFEKIIQFYVDAYDFRHINLRLFDVYGEDDKRPKLLNILKDISGTSKSIDVSPGEQYLDLVHISDVCSAYESAFNHLSSNINCINQVFGVYTGNQMKLKHIILLFEKLLKKKLNVNFGGKKYKNREVMTPSKKYAILPNWKPTILIEEGLKRYVSDIKHD